MITATAAVNEAVNGARSLPDLVRRLETLDPAAASQLTGKLLLQSKSPPAILIATGIVWVSTKYGLGWDADFAALVSGAVLAGVAYAMRYVTSHPIAGIFKRAS